MLSSILGFINVNIIVWLFGHENNGYYSNIIMICQYLLLFELGLTSFSDIYISQSYFKGKMEEFSEYYNKFRELFSRLQLLIISLTFIIAFTFPLLSEGYVYHHSYWKSAIILLLVTNAKPEVWLLQYDSLALIKDHRHRYIWELTFRNILLLFNVSACYLLKADFYIVMVIKALSDSFLSFLFKYIKYRTYKNIIPEKKKSTINLPFKKIKYNIYIQLLSRLSLFSNIPIISYFLGNVFVSYFVTTNLVVVFGYSILADSIVQAEYATLANLYFTDKNKFHNYLLKQVLLSVYSLSMIPLKRQRNM